MSNRVPSDRDSVPSDLAAELDAADPLAEYVERFVPGDDLVAYLDGNSLGRPLSRTLETLPEVVRTQWGGRLIRAWDEGWLTQAERLGDRIGAACVGAASGQTIVAESTTVLIFKLLRAAIAARPGRDELVVLRDEFPTDRYIVERLAEDHARTRRAAEALAQAAPGTVQPGTVETNILVLDVGAAGWTGPGLVAAAGEAGVLGYPTGPRHARYVWHLDVDDPTTDAAVDVLAGLLRRGPA